MRLLSFILFRSGPQSELQDILPLSSVGLELVLTCRKKEFKELEVCSLKKPTKQTKLFGF